MPVLDGQLTRPVRIRSGNSLKNLLLNGDVEPPGEALLVVGHNPPQDDKPEEEEGNENKKTQAVGDEKKRWSHGLELKLFLILASKTGGENGLVM